MSWRSFKARNAVRISTLIALAVAAATCSSPENSPLVAPAEIAVDVVPSCDVPGGFPGMSVALDSLAKGKSEYFRRGDFPTGVNGRDDWYGKHLKAMNEPSLITRRKEGVEIYRFLWLRTFHHPIAIRVERTVETINISAVELDGQGGYEPGRILDRSTKTIDNAQWCDFLSRLSRSNYWNMGPETELGGHDGAQWILEAVRDGRYHFVDRWTPEGGDFRDACIFLLELGGFDTNKLGDDLY